MTGGPERSQQTATERPSRFLVGSLALLGLISAYLAATAGPGQGRAVLVLALPLLGLAATVAWAVRWWRRRPEREAGIAAVLLAAGSAATLLPAALGRSAVAPHLLLGVAGWAALVVVLRGQPRRRRIAIAAALGLALAAAAGAAASRRDAAPEPFVNPPAAESLAGEALGGESGPFYPSAARTVDGEPVAAAGPAAQESCGSAGCHPREAAEWASSGHRWSGVADPWYRRALEEYRGRHGAVAARWCAGCHDPALLLSGNAGEPPAALAARPEAAAGVGCTMCHGIAAAGSTIGQAHYTVDPPPEAAPATGLASLLIRLDPETHRRAWSRPALTGPAAAELCATCHKGHYDGLLNGHRFVEMVNDFDPWQAASFSGRGARSFYWPEPRDCADCHLPERPDGGRSHRFAAADTTSALLAGDDEQLAAVAEFLGRDQVTVDLFALSAGPPGGEGVAELRAAPLDRAPAAAVRAGESVRVDAVIRVRGVGHFFPGGKNDGVECWLELRAVDALGRLVFSSGAGEAGGPVDPGAHFLRRRRLGDDGSPVDLRDGWRARAELYMLFIQPNTADVVRYRLEVPPGAGGELRLEARLRYRQHAWAFDRWVRESAEGPLPELPVLTVAEDAVTLRVLAEEAPAEGAPGAAEPGPAAFPEDRERWNDYGIGLSFQGDLRGARAAFTRVTEIDPGWVDGWVNLARVALSEGDVEALAAALERAETLAPDLARVRYHRGRLEERLGNLPAAREHLGAVAAEYPGDRLVRAQLGRVLLLAGENAAAAAEFEAVLAVDPQSAAAHFSLNQAYRAAGDTARADHHLRLYERFRPDEEAPARSRVYLEGHPDDNRERQSIHEHRSALAPEPAPDAEAGR